MLIAIESALNSRSLRLTSRGRFLIKFFDFLILSVILGATLGMMALVVLLYLFQIDITY